MNMCEEKKKEGLLEALYSHLNVAYLSASKVLFFSLLFPKGSMEKLNSIIEQIVKPSKPTQQICSWVDTFTRLIIQLSKSHQDPKMIIDIVLYKIPWFTSENHLKAIQSFKLAIMTITSLYPQKITYVYGMLVAQLNIDADSSQIRNEKQEIMVGGKVFLNRESIHLEVHRILQTVESIKEDAMVTLSPNQETFMMDVFRHHPNAQGKLQGIKSLAIGYFPARQSTKCFYVVRHDGSVDDISYVKSIDNMFEQEHEQYEARGHQYYQVMRLITELDQINRLQQQRLVTIINDTFPHKTRPVHYIRTYVTNLLYLCDMIPAIRGKLIRTIVNNLLSMDSEIKQEQRKLTCRKSQIPDETTKKLDELLSVLLDYLQSKVSDTYRSEQRWTSGPSKILDQAEMLEIYREISQIFFNTILKNQTCFMVHFIYIFLCAQTNYPRVQQFFISRLILNIKDKKEPLSKQQRINSIVYLCSLLMRCNGIKQTVLLRSMDILLSVAREELQCNDAKNEILLHLIQMFAILVDHLPQPLSKQVCHFFLEAHITIDALTYVHIDAITRLNDFLLTIPKSEETDQLIEITAAIHRKQFERRSVSPNNSHLGTPSVIDPESYSIATLHSTYYSKSSAWTSRPKQNKPVQTELEFVQPFNNWAFVHSEPILLRCYVTDTQIDQMTSNPLKRKAAEPLNDQYEIITKKVK